MKTKIIKDSELHLLMGKLRSIVGEDCRIIFKTTKKGSQLLAAYYPGDEGDDEDDSEPAYDFNQIGQQFTRTTPQKLRGRKHDLTNYFG